MPAECGHIRLIIQFRQYRREYQKPFGFGREIPGKVINFVLL
jgi:hypothetical protein